MKLFFKRFYRRLKFAFSFNDMIMWPYESCKKCGTHYRLLWKAKQHIFEKVIGNDSGCYCISCFLKIAEIKKINIKENDFEFIKIFIPNKVKE